MNENVLESIKENEGFRSKPYIDPLSKKKIPKEDLAVIEKHWDNLNITIGYGDSLKIKSELDTEFENNLNFDFYILPDHVKNVLIEMAYQMGVNGLLKFKKTLEHIENKQYEKASIEMLDSNWARQTPLRAKKLSNLMKGGK